MELITKVKRFLTKETSGKTFMLIFSIYSTCLYIVAGILFYYLGFMDKPEDLKTYVYGTCMLSVLTWLLYFSK